LATLQKLIVIEPEGNMKQAGIKSKWKCVEQTQKPLQLPSASLSAFVNQLSLFYMLQNPFSKMEGKE
jgi:hypothetical protein